MAVHTSVDPRTIARAADDIRQLTRPLHIAIRGRIITHPPLLTQLRAACQPGATTRGPERRSVPRSRPAANLDAIQDLSGIYVELAGWHARQRLPSPPAGADWHTAVMRQLVGALPDMAPSVADWCATEIHDWWHLAATRCGWRPADLLKIR